ncbi:hypothetical protein [Limimaricola sp. ASW11-118]
MRLTVEGPHIASVECLCISCQKAARVLEALPGAEPILDVKGATPFVLHRKDCVAIVAGQEKLMSHRLTDGAGTRRVAASCCNTPVFLEMKGGHWLSLYAALWPKADRPVVELRTMIGERDDLPRDLPNLKTHSIGFYGRLFGAWVRMGFRNPRFPDSGELPLEGG